MNCFVIQRQVTGVYYSIRNNDTNVSSVLAFKNLYYAKNMLKLINTFDSASNTKQTLIIKPIQDSFIERCKKNKLNIIMFSEKDGEINYSNL
jgi:hypothetical protein